MWAKTQCLVPSSPSCALQLYNQFLKPVGLKKETTNLSLQTEGVGLSQQSGYGVWDVTCDHCC